MIPYCVLLSFSLAGLFVLLPARADEGDDPGDAGLVGAWAGMDERGRGTEKALSEDYHFRSGLLYHARGDLQKALEEFERVVELKPDDPAAHLNLGIVLGDLGRLDDALKEFGEALRIKPDSASAEFNRGSVFMRKDAHHEAIAAFERALVLGADTALLHYNLAVCHEFAGGRRYGKGFNGERSIQHYKKALEEEPESAVIHYNLGMVYLRVDERERAERELRKAVELDPEMADAYLQIGLLMLENRNYHSALRNVREAKRLDPNMSVESALIEAHSGLGQFFLDNGDYGAARKHYEEVVRLDPGRASDLVQLGRAHRGLGACAEAVACFREALSLDGGLPLSEELAETYSLWGDTLDKEGLYDLAAAKYEIALFIRPGYAERWVKLGRVFHYDIGEKGKAIHAYRKALTAGLPVAQADRVKRELADAVRGEDRLVRRYRDLVSKNPGNATLHYNLGVFYHLRDNIDAAIGEYTLALRLDPENSFAHYNVGLAYQRKGMKRSALQEFKKAIRYNPSYARASYALGRLYEEMGEREKARSAYERAVELEPDFADAHLALGLLLQRGRGASGAREYLRRYFGLRERAAPDGPPGARSVREKKRPPP